MENEKKYIRINDELVEVDNKIYMTFYKMKRREKYLIESDLKHGKVSYNALDSSEYTGESIIIDKDQNIEEEIINKIMIEKLKKSLEELSEDEITIIKQIFYCNKSERQVASEMSIPRKTLSYKKQKILNKLKNLIES